MASEWRWLWGVAPAGLVVGVLFGGGLAQAIGTSLEGDGQAYARMLDNPDFMPALWLTLRVALVSTVLSATLAVVLALALRRVGGSRGGKIARALAQIPLPTPHLAVALALLMLLSPSGLADRLFDAARLADGDLSWPVLVNDGWGVGIVATYVWKETPFLLVLVLSALRGETLRLEEVARNLGAGRLRVWVTVTLPAMAPSVALGSLLVFGYAFGAFEVPLILGTTRPTMVGVLAWQLYTDVDLNRRPEAMAVALTIVLVILAVALGVVGVRGLWRRAQS